MSSDRPNYFQARKLGLPILITPFAALNPGWALTQIILHQFLLSVNTPPASSLSSFRFHPLFNHELEFQRPLRNSQPAIRIQLPRIPDRLPRRDSTYRFRWLCR